MLLGVRLVGRLSSEEADFVTDGAAVGNTVEGVCSGEEIVRFFWGGGPGWLGRWALVPPNPVSRSLPSTSC